ncbi:MAG: TetR/AcrR family transcriptional regulator [Myxococcota bacterium]|jgi:AcrR family transcriptional regulator|nr:TetR/AcrR family transcriptional regulator [Myxococcota bacterium]
MTKHRKKDDWIEHILEAAGEAVIEGGWSNLTMESIAARTELSKGGLYRFFPNKRTVALALFERCYTQYLAFDTDEAVSWNLPIAQTITRILFVSPANAATIRTQLIFLQLGPETFRDEEFRKQRENLLLAVVGRFRELCARLFLRDGQPFDESASQKLETALMIGVALMEGLTFQSSFGTPLSDQIHLVGRFVEIMVHEVIGSHTP